MRNLPAVSSAAFSTSVVARPLVDAIFLLYVEMRDNGEKPGSDTLLHLEIPRNAVFVRITEKWSEITGYATFMFPYEIGFTIATFIDLRKLTGVQKKAMGERFTPAVYRTWMDKAAEVDGEEAAQYEEVTEV